MPPVRCKHDIFACRSQPLAWPPDADNIARHVRNPYNQLLAFLREPAPDNARERVSNAGRRWFFGPVQFWRDQWSRLTPTWSLSASFRFPGCPWRSRAAVAICNRGVPPRQHSPHCVQHVGAYGYWSADRRAVRVGALSIYLRCDRHRRESRGQGGGPFQLGGARGCFWVG